MQGFELIRQKLAAYRRKRALFQLVRGSLLLLLVLLAITTVLLVGEGMLWMSVGARTALVVLLVLIAVFLLAWWVVRPAIRYLGWGPQESEADVAWQLGRLFPSIQDKLVNYLELQHMPAQDNSLLAAALEQRTAELQPIPFASAVTFRPNWRLARWLLAPVLLLVLMAAIQPRWVFDSGTRLARFREPFVPPPPFQITIGNHAPQLVAGTDHTITVEVTGDALPDELYLYQRRGSSGDYHALPLQRDGNGWRYTFQSVQEDFSYYIGNALHGSTPRTTRVRQRPSLRQFQIVLTPPAYTGLRSDTLAMNVGQFRTPAGTNVRLIVAPLFAVDSAWVEATPAVFGPVRKQALQFAARLFEEGQFRIRLRSRDGLLNPDTVQYQYQVIPDRAPSVELVPPPTGFLPPQGLVGLDALLQDDYGLRRAELLYRIADGPDQGRIQADFQVLPLTLASAAPSQRLVSEIDFLGLDIRQGETIEYAVRVWDNDAVTGSKPGQSIVHRLNYASTEKLYDNLNQQAEQVEQLLENAIDGTRQITKEVEDVARDLMAKRELGADDRRRLEQLTQQQQQVQQNVEQAQDKLEEAREQSQENQLAKPETDMRLDQLKQMLTDLNPKELEQMLREMQRSQTPDRSQMQSLAQQLQRKNRDLKADLERIREMFKQWKARQQMDQLSRQVQEQALRQQELERMTQQRREEKPAGQPETPQTPRQQEATQRKDSTGRTDTQPEGKADKAQQAPSSPTSQPEEKPDPKSTQSLADAQRKLNEQTKQNQKLLDQLQQNEAKSLQEQAEQVEQLQERQQQIQQQQQQAQQQLQQGNRKPAARAQRQAMEQMQEQVQQLSQMQQQANQSQTQENYDDLRRLLANLLKLSFNQEQLRDDTRKLDEQDPALMQAERRQTRLADDMLAVRDSLESLARRAKEIGQNILTESRSIAEQMDFTQQALDERQVGRATVYQQNVMTSLNNLANMLTESLRDMQNSLRMQMQGQNQGRGQQQQPGQGMQDLIRQQRSLNEAMQELEQLVRQKEQEGQGKQGDPLDAQTQERLQEQAEQQEQIRQQLQAIFQQLQQQGTQAGTLGKAGEDMQETVEELRKLEVTRELRQRQQDILSRMLQFDKAMRVRERDQQRQGRSAQQQEEAAPPAGWDNPQEQNRLQREQLLRIRSQFSPAYQQLIDEYLRRLPRSTSPGQQP